MDKIPPAARQAVDLPTDVKEKAAEPPDWDPLDIRVTWLKNLKR
ncbi:MAG: hypothetical protein OXQ94_03295 [Gemmatimonadota bacterium]|nr:hypothetical protein [Gemmatimonadota bacterium]MDE2870704.1 hypothetical protein [Gemmatimonadota bacterium]